MSTARARPTIGLLNAGFSSAGFATGRRLFEHVADAACARGVDLVCIAGEALKSPYGFEAQANVLYDLLGPQHIDGLVVWGGALGTFVPEDDLARLCRRGGVPVVVVGAGVRGISSVLLDFHRSMLELMAHLCDVHGYRRIAFVRGPAGHDEAEQRHRAYREALEARGIPLDPELVLSGDFRPEAGRAAVATLLDRGVKLDAICSVNDDVATGVLEALALRGRAVPGDIAVTGFDDIDRAEALSTPLTTVRFEIGEAGRRALEMVLARLAGKDVPEAELLPMRTVIRRSCGCTPRERGRAWAPVRIEGSPVDELARRREAIEREVGAAAGLRPEWASLLVRGFFADLESAGTPASLSHWDGLLRRAEAATVGRDAWHDVLSVLRSQVLPILAGDPALLRRAVDVAHELRMLVSDWAVWKKEQQMLEASNQSLVLGEIGARLLTTFDVPLLMTVLFEQLPRVGIHTAYVCLYDDRERTSAKLVLAYGPEGRAPLPPEGRRFSTADLLPMGFTRPDARSTFIVHALFFREEQLGYVVLGIDDKQRGGLSQTIRDHVSTALKGAMLIQQTEARARELETAYETQERQRERLVTAERMASLGRLTAGIAHEMNTPLAAVRSSLLELLELVVEYRASIGNETVTADDHRAVAQDMQNAVRVATTAAESASAFVRSIKSHTRELAAIEKQIFEAAPVIEEALLLVSHKLRERGCTVSLRQPDHAVRIAAVPGRLVQVVTNLVLNAVDASAEKGGGPIDVALGTDGDQAVLTVTDRGVGIPPDAMSRIFDPMFTTKPFGESSGLGLTVVHAIVTGELGGTVDVQSEVGSGTAVTIRVPRAKS